MEAMSATIGDGGGARTPMPRTVLVAPYRETISAIPPIAVLWGFWCLNMARYPLHLFWAFLPWRACEMEVEDTPTKGVSQRYLRDSLYKNKAKCVRYLSLRCYLKRVSRDMGGVSRTGPLRGPLGKEKAHKSGAIKKALRGAFCRST